MKPNQVSKRSIATGLAILYSLILFTPMSAYPKVVSKGNQTMNPKNVINQKRFSNWQNSSFEPYTSDLKRNELWKLQSPEGYSDEAPYHLCIADNLLLAIQKKGIIAIDKITGKIAWERKFVNTYEFEIGPDGIIVIDPHDEFYTLSLQNVKKNGTSIPIFSEIRTILYVQPGNGNFFYVYNRYPSQFDTPELNQGFTIQKYDATTNDVSFEYDGPAPATCFALSNDGKVCFLGVDNHLYSFPVSLHDGKEIIRSDFPYIYSFSVFKEDDLILCTDSDKTQKDHSIFKKRILSISPKGKIHWELPISDLAKSGQPPAFAAGGNIYYCAGNSLLCIKDGKLAWEYELSAGAYESYLTVLGDQSVLIAALNILTHISPEGHILKSITNPFIFTCRPIIDPNGRMYIAGKEGIRCLD